jgi:hypothetical protein
MPLRVPVRVVTVQGKTSVLNARAPKKFLKKNDTLAKILRRARMPLKKAEKAKVEGRRLKEGNEVASKKWEL